MGIRLQEIRILPEWQLKARTITDFVSKPYSIFFVMKKKMGEDKYNELVYEKTRDIFSKINFEDVIKAKLDEKFLIQSE